MVSGVYGVYGVYGVLGITLSWNLLQRVDIRIQRGPQGE